MTSEADAIRGVEVKCKHPPESVTADILEGGVPGQGVEWCRVCGAYRRHFLGVPSQWREPKHYDPAAQRVREG